MKAEFNVREEYFIMRIDIAHEIKDKLVGMDAKTRIKEMNKLDRDMAMIVEKLMRNNRLS